MVKLRLARPDDLDLVLPRTAALNAHENIPVEPGALRSALAKLLAEPELGCVFLVVDDHPIGYAIVTYGYDLEFAGRDAYLTEIWIDEAARARGAGGAVLALLEPEMRARGVRALHLFVRPENRALHLYERAGYERIPRYFYTKKL